MRMMMAKTKSFAFSAEEEEGAALLPLQWFWKEIIHNSSDQDQSPVYYVLCASYALVSVAALALEQVLMDLPGLMFFSTFTLLVLFWAEIYNQARSLPADKLRPCYYIINGIIYFLQANLHLDYMSISKTVAGEESAELFLAVISFCAVLGFLIYGGRLSILLLRFPLESRGRVNKLYEVGSVTCICCTCFLIRCVMLAIFAFNKSPGFDVLEHPVLNLFYYMLVEIIPFALVLFILRKMPSSRPDK